MSYSFFKNTLALETKAFSNKQAILYGIYNTEKIIDNYKLIFEEYKIPENTTVRTIGNNIWSFLLAANVSFNEYNIEKYILDSEKYPGVFNALSLNVCICLQVIHDVFFEHKTDIHLTGVYVYDSIIQIYLAKNNNIKFITSDVLKLIDELPIIKNEINNQLEVVKLIKDNVVDQKLVALLKDKSELHKINYASFNY